MLSFDWTTNHGLIRRWYNMMCRCYDTENPAYKNYGGRGITVHADWHDPYKYIAELPADYFKGAELDRIDNNGNYEPGNIRWLSRRDNTNNRRICIPIEYKGRTQTLSQWARELGLNRGTLDTRLYSWNWDIQRAFETPSMTANERMAVARAKRYEGHVYKLKPNDRQYRTIVYNGETMTLMQLSKICGITVKLLYKRIFERNWPVEKAVGPKQR